MNGRENWSRSKEVLAAYFRHGLSELGSALYGPGTVAQPPEYGMIGTKPPSMVVEGLRGEQEHGTAREEGSVLDRHLRDAQERADHAVERDEPAIERQEHDAPERESG